MEKIINNISKIYIDEGYRNFQKYLCEVCNVDSIEELNKVYDAYFIICDYNTYNNQLHHVMNHIKGKYIYEYIINPGEESKTIDNYEKILKYCKKINLSRKSLIIALGGGVVGDLSGFVAATYMRGIDIVQMPTSLLAQVDSSIGGKTGINLGNSKNIVGAFHQPVMTYINVESLKTLPEKEYVSGMGEIIKYAFIKDYDLIDYLIENYEDILDRKVTTLSNIVKRCAQIKADIVEADEKEGDLRKILNFGHTFGHGIEKLCHLSHGEAVVIGMNMAFKLALKLEKVTPKYYNEFLNLCNTYKLPTTFDYENEQEVFDIMKDDKKNSFSKINLVLPTEEGKVNIFDNIENDLVMEIIKECKNA